MSIKSTTKLADLSGCHTTVTTRSTFLPIESAINSLWVNTARLSRSRFNRLFKVLQKPKKAVLTCTSLYFTS